MIDAPGATSAIDSDGDKVTVFISNVLGLSDPNDPNQGNIQRYSFRLPDSDHDWVSSSGSSPGTLGTPTQMFSGYAHMPFI